MADKEKKASTGRKRPKNFLKKVQNSWGLILTVSMVLVAAVLVTIPLVHLQLGENGELLRSANSKTQEKYSLDAVRGSIYDTTGKTLATNSIVWDIWCDPSYSTAFYKQDEESKKDVVDQVKCAEVSGEIVRRLMSEDGTNLEAVDKTSVEYQTKLDEIYKQLTNIQSKYVVLAKGVNNAVKLSIEEYVKKASEKGSRISIKATSRYQRTYPYGSFASAVLGFCNTDGYGQYGLEASYQTTLAGVNGSFVGVKNGGGTFISKDVTYEAKDGDSLVLSLDVTVQEIVERYLDEAIAANNVKNRGCAIVMDVNTGAILAMASRPDFNPNTPYTILNESYLHSMVLADPKTNNGKYLTNENGDVVRDSAGYAILREDADYSGTYREIQWRNKAITETYYPGSIFKVIASAMALDSSKAVGETQLYCKGYYQVADRTYHCAGKKTHGLQDMATALRNSCNIYFIQLGQILGATDFYEYFQAFGFTEKTGVDLPGESRSMQYYTANRLGAVELASSSFGQSMTVTPLQVCTAIAACTNGGYLVTPHLVDRIVDENGNVVSEIGTTVRRQVISKSASRVIRNLMEYEVGDGTTSIGGSKAYVAGYRIGGKSGTSEKLDTEKRRYDGDYRKVASFVAVLPINDPQILVYVMLDDPNNAKTDYSSILAAPVVGNIISEVAPYLGLEKDGIDRSQTTVRVPNLVGMEWSNAQVKLNTRGLEHRLIRKETTGAGKSVTYQYPSEREVVPSGTIIYLYTDSSTGEETTVPDVSGKTGEFAKQILNGASLNCIVVGSGTVQSQSVAAGTAVQRGTIVTVTCG